MIKNEEQKNLLMKDLSKMEMINVSGGMSERQERWANACMRAGGGRGSVFQTLTRSCCNCGVRSNF